MRVELSPLTNNVSDEFIKPIIVRFLLKDISVELNAIIAFPPAINVGSKLMVSLLLAFIIASLNEPAPESLRLVTVIVPEKLKKPIDTVYGYLDQKKKKKPTLKELSVDFQKVYKKKQEVLKKPSLEKSWEELLDKKREVVSQTKKSKKEIDQKMKIVTTVAKDIWEKRDLLKKERIKEALAEKKELLRAEAKKQAKAQERKQKKKDDRFF